MRIEKCLNSTLAEIVAKRENILIGASLSNKYFSDEKLLTTYISWALTNCDHILLMIPDELQAINYRVIDGYRKEQALNVALRKGREMENRIQKIIKECFLEQKDRITILHWEDIRKTTGYTDRRNIVFQAFKNDPSFKTKIIDCVTEHTSKLRRSFQPANYEELAAYLIDELPILLTGVEWKNIHYTTNLYPGISSINHLTIDLQNGATFPKITKSLGLKNKTNWIEAYAE